MPSVFLSHSWKDTFFARKLSETLADCGVTVWIDEAELRVGHSLLEKTSCAITQADFVAVILSHSMVTREEARRAESGPEMVRATGVRFRPAEPALRVLTREDVLMKTFMICVVAVVAAAGPGVAVAGECAPGGARFKGTAVQADAVGIARGFSSDGQAVTLLFDNLLVDVGLRRGPLVKTRTLSVSLPIERKDQEVTLTQDVRGYVDMDCGARAVLVVQAAGQTTCVDLKEANKRNHV